MNNLTIALNALDKAIHHLSNVENIDIESSINKDIKLKLDKELNQIIVNSLKKDSEYSILSEEMEFVDKENDYMWVVDPLDGSLNFSRGINICAISIGLIQKNDFVMGIIYDIGTKDIYIGTQKGAFCNENQIQVSQIIGIENSIISTGFPVNSSFDENKISNFVKQVKDYKKVRLFGSAAMSLCYVASGKIEAYKEDNIMIWDVAAGISICKFAGAKVFVEEGTVKNSLNVFVSNN